MQNPPDYPGQYPQQPPPQYGQPYQPYRVDPTAVMGRRIGAFLIDVVIGTVISVIIVFASAEAYEGTPFLDNPCEFIDDDEYICAEGEDGDVVLFKIADLTTAGFVGLGMWFANSVILQSLTGGTVGKLMTGVRVVDANGRRAPFGRVLLRSLFLLLDYSFCVLIGLITALVSSGHQRVGDMVAKTYVVAAPDVGRPPRGGDAAAPPGAP
ncbi:MAG: RDD family protein, partial [Actinomycetota bacterium]|nr:RDD family protein [Actinomycetota bacterium]